MLWKSALAGGIALLGAGEAIPTEYGGAAVQWTALAILAGAVAGLFKELRAERKSHQKVVDTISEQQHADHGELVETLTKLRIHCAGEKSKRDDAAARGVDVAS